MQDQVSPMMLGQESRIKAAQLGPGEQRPGRPEDERMVCACCGETVLCLQCAEIRRLLLFEGRSSEQDVILRSVQLSLCRREAKVCRADACVLYSLCDFLCKPSRVAGCRQLRVRSLPPAGVPGCSARHATAYPCKCGQDTPIAGQRMQHTRAVSGTIGFFF